MDCNYFFDSLLDNREQFDYLKDLSTDEVTFLKEKVHSIDKKYLYKYEYHGIYHSQKVFLFGYLLSKKFDLSDDEKKILFDALILHDCGRINDFEEETHGLVGANKLATIFYGDTFYSQGNNLDILQAIVDAHSVDDSRAQNIAENYGITNKDSFNLLFMILKDADALDRTRFPKSIEESIKENFLRFDFSKQLIPLAYKVNSYYTMCINKARFESYSNEYFTYEKKQDFMHSIGWDFSKLESILEFGILSEYAASSRGLSLSRNFAGNNSNMWISVVSGSQIHKKGKAYNSFLMDGISLYGLTSKLCDGETIKSKAESLGLPKKSGEYDDESFVFYEVPVDDIYAIVLPKKSINDNLSSLNYFGCAYAFRVINDRTQSYIKYINDTTGITVDSAQLNSKIEKLKKLQLDFSSQNKFEQIENINSFLNETNEIVSSINQDVGSWMDRAFSFYFNLNEDEHPTVGMMISDILKRKQIEHKVFYGDSVDDGTTVMLDRVKTKNSK